MRISKLSTAPVRRRASALALLSALTLAPGAALANELLNVYRDAASNDTVLQAAGFARDAGLQARPQARASLLPQINGAYGYTDSTDKTRSSAGGFDEVTGEPLPPGQRNTTDSTRDSLSVSLDQTLFDWGAFKRYGRSGAQVDLAEINYRAAEQELVLRTAQAYFNVLAAADNLQFAQSENKAIERQLEQAKKRFEVGLSAVTDVQEAQAAYDLTVAAILQAEQSLEVAKQALREITASPEVKLVPLREDFELPGPNPADVQAWIDRALENNYQLTAVRLGTRLAAYDVSIARAGHLPTVSLGASYSDSEIETDSVRGNTTRDSRGHSVGVNVRLPIFAGGYVRSTVKQAESIQQQREAEEEGARRSVERQTRDAYLGVISGAAQVKALKQAVLSNTTSLEASQTGFEVGTRTTVDVLNSQRDLFNAQRNYAAARYNYLLSILALKAAAGALTENDLAEIDALLVAG